MIRRRRLAIGAEIAVDGPGGKVTATVVSYTSDGTVQVVSATDSAGHVHRLAIDLTQPEGAEAEAVDIAFARQLALQVASGHRHRMPVTMEANILADAVIALTGGRSA